MIPDGMNTREWWNDYFDGNWEQNDGPAQTRYFMEELLAHLPEPERLFLKSGGKSILDWGCAFGQGVEVLAKYFPDCEVSGLDFSGRAIEEARKRYAGFAFLHAGDGHPPHDFDVVVTSNCIEHFTDPMEVCRGLVGASRELFIATVPCNEAPLIDQHFAQFREESFPPCLGDFRLIATRVYDSDPAYWSGRQLLAVYGSAAYLAKRLAGEIDEEGGQRRTIDPECFKTIDPAETVRLAAEDFAQRIMAVVPAGGRILAVGEGHGFLSLALARRGDGEVHLLSSSTEFLDQARRLFEAQGEKAHFIEGDPLSVGRPEYDLVFCALPPGGRTEKDERALWKAMAGRSRKYVACLEPNPSNYWRMLYGLAREEGGEAPKGLLDSLDLHPVGRAFIGWETTRAVIARLKRMPPDLLRDLFALHRDARMPQEMSGYFRITLAAVIGMDRELPEGWHPLPPAADAFERTPGGRASRAPSQRDALAEKASPEGGVFEEETAERGLLPLLVRLRRRIAPDGTRRYRVVRWGVDRAAFILGKARTWYHLFCLSARSRGLPAPMTWHAYAFDRFRRARINNQMNPDLQGLRSPGEAGLVSLVLPVYNGERYLEEALDSVLAQTYPHFELIAVDDGSRDETPRILAGYAARDPRIRVFTQENRKLPQALNNGFQSARGEYFTWISADNRLKPDFLAKMTRCLESHPGWDMVYADEDILGEDGAPLKNSPWFAGYQKPRGTEHIRLPADPSELNTRANNYVGGAFLYRSRVPYLLGEYNPTLFGLEDYDYWMRLNSLLRLRHADFTDPVYEYRFHGDSLTSRDRELKITESREALMVFDDFRRDFHLTPLAWFIEAEEEQDTARSVRRGLEERVLSAGHTLLSLQSPYLDRLPRLWCPMAYCGIISPGGKIPSVPDRVPLQALKVLIVAGDAGGMENPGPEWDLCVALGADETPPPRTGPWRGWLSARDVETLFTAVDIRTRSEHLALIEEEIRTPPALEFNISVIICTYRRPEGLGRTLETVLAQDLPAKDYEIIVVNNDCLDGTVLEVIDGLEKEYRDNGSAPIRMVACPFEGLSFARNAGIAEARGRVLHFLDDDALLEEGCLWEMWKAFMQHHRAGAVGGRILVKAPDPPPPWLKPDWLCYWSHFDPRGDHYREVKYWWQYPWGANWAARRKALLEIGGFRTRYGRVGAGYQGGEELISAALIQRLGYAIGIAPKSRVIHDIEPGRFSLKHAWHTSASALHVAYQAQRDLYFPMEQSLFKTGFKICGASVLAAFSLFRGWPECCRKLAHVSAQSRLLGRQLKDWIRRCRKSEAVSR